MALSPIDPHRGHLYTARMLRMNLVLAAVVASGLVGCIRLRVEPGSSPTPEVAAATSTPLSLPSPVPSPVRSSTALPTVEVVSPTEVHSYSGPCPPEPADIPIPEIKDALDYGGALIQYLNAGGTVEGLVGLVDALSTSRESLLRAGFAQADLNGDSIEEIVLSLVDYDDGWAPGRVYVAMCGDRGYELAYVSEGKDPYFTTRIDSIFDITGDGLDDLIIELRGCGAHTCFLWPEVVAWTDFGFRDRMGDTYFDLPNTGIEFFGPSPNGSYQIYMTGNGVSSVGAGPYHRRAVTWVYDPHAGSFLPTELVYLPSPWRIHFVHDGDQAFALGNYALALENYNRVIHDQTLKDWPSAEWDAEYEQSRPSELAAYARFRRILTRLKLGDKESAAVHYQALIDNHLPGAYGYAFAQMGEAFWSEYTASGDFNRACEAAQVFAPVGPSVDFPPLEYGYSNPTYTAEGMCPADP